MRAYNKNIIYGLYDDEQDLLDAVKEANTSELDIWDVFTPFAVHGLDELLGLAESRLHIGGFVFGMIGTLTAFLGMTWIFVRDWPNVFGGKPYWSVPAFIPITFELTVLFAAIGMTVTFYVINGQGPGVVTPVLDNRITDDKFCIAFDASHGGQDKFRLFFSRTGASEVNEKTI